MMRLITPSIEPERQQGPTGLDHDQVAATVAREIHPGIVRLKRSEFLVSLTWLIPAAVVLFLAARNPRRLGVLVFIAVVAIATVVRRGAEWLRARRDDPVVRFHRQEHEEVEQATAIAEHRIRASAVRPSVTYALVATISVVTWIQFLGPGVQQSLVLAALVKPAVFAGQWWRLLSVAYLHGSLLHWLMNMSGLIALGSLIEIYERRSMIAPVFVLSAIGGALASTALIAIMPAPSVGASGGIMGLAGYLFIVSRGSTRLPPWIAKRMVSVFSATAIFGLASFFFIDNAAHLGGTITGILVGLLVRSDPETAPTPMRERLVDVLIWGGTLLFAGGALFTITRLTRFA
jgi:membrane associated rhomboid family serine protease